MTDELKTVNELLPNIPVAIIGTGDGGDHLLAGTIAKTPGSSANLIITSVISPLVAITVRVAYMFMKSLLGGLTLAMIPPGDNPVLLAMHAMDFYHLFLTCLGLAVAPTVLDLVQSLVTILGNLERTHPLASGSV